ncbi:aminotransferase class V-fold PLP-dependent enzyme [Isoptericola hypogeus]|uniref:Aminotransferase class V-fold PLP-dependent enzyme n=1 Tax=Isoptericola hypogeus TaxID=300179 RepID=A0ABN2JVG5_9MICO
MPDDGPDHGRDDGPAVHDDQQARLLGKVARYTADYRAGLAARPVGARADDAELRARLGGPLPQEPSSPEAVVDALVAAAEDGLVASAGPRYFGFVVGGSSPASLAADWLTSGWDQNAGAFALSPASAVAEDVAGTWLLELLGLPAGASVGFTTGATMANATCLAAARSSVLARAGWDVERDGLFGAPPIHVVVGEDRHISIELALRYLGLGSDRVHRVAADDQGRMRADDLAAVLDGCSGPTVVAAQAGNVNSGSFDPVDEVCRLSRAHDAWVHVDGAFGIWAAASPRHRHLVRGVEAADSWAVDAHKWLNVPYDSGFAIVADPRAHLRATGLPSAGYLEPHDSIRRDNADWVPEMSRRARGFTVWAAIRELGRSGVADLVDRCCRHAARFAQALGAAPGVEILGDVVLNQVLVRFHRPDGDDDDDADALTRAVVAAVQAEGTCWLGGTTWRGRAAMRISVSGGSTTDADVDRTVAAILAAAGDGSLPAPAERRG